MPSTVAFTANSTSWGNWRTLSDQDLLSRDFVADDPENLEGVIKKVRDGEMPAPEFDYNMGHREGLVRCAFCRKENHFLGVVARYPDGARILVGRICAGKHLGVAFKNNLRDFDAARSRRDLVLRQMAVAKHQRTLLIEMRRLVEHPSVEAFSALRGRTRDFLGSLWTGLAHAANRDEELKIDKLVPDRVAEEKLLAGSGLLLGKQRRQFLRDSGKRPMMYISESLGHISGRSFFKTGENVSVVLKRLQSDLQNAMNVICSKDVPSGELTQAFAALSDVRAKAIDEISRLQDATNAFSQKNLEVVANWLNYRSKYRARSESIEAFDRSDFKAVNGALFDRGWKMTLPEAYHAPSDDLIVALTAAIAETGH